jgi:hypothetical protein
MNIGAVVEIGSTLVPEPVCLVILCTRLTGFMCMSSVPLDDVLCGHPGIGMPGMQSPGGFCAGLPSCPLAGIQIAADKKTSIANGLRIYMAPSGRMLVAGLKKGNCPDRSCPGHPARQVD